MHYFTVWDGSQQVQITLAYMVMKSVIAMEAIRMTLWPFRGFQSYDEAIWGHFYCKIALFHPPFWPLGNAGKDLKIILGEFLEPKPHAKFFSGPYFEVTGTFFPLKVGDFGPFLGGRWSTSKLTDGSQIWNHASFGLPLHLWSPFLLVPSLGRPPRPIFQNWSDLGASPLCSPTVTPRPFYTPKSA